MCGICGFIHKHDTQEQILIEMNKEIAYRGPDDEGTYFSRIGSFQLGFAHRRLSILDLSSNGHQPMESMDGSVIITFNGEIYNFQQIRGELEQKGYLFRTKTDTEVIINSYLEWGIDAVNRFNGMFAFALFDRKQETVYLVRDRMGVKPLYYFIDGDNLAFSSELKPLMKYPYFKKSIDFDALKLYLALQYIPNDKSIFENTYKLLPGEILKWKKGKIERERYWSVSDVIKQRQTFTGSYKEAKEQLKCLLKDAVSLRMISDVPFGAFLSNGIDSSLMVAIMQSVSKEPIRTFTIGFNGSDTDESYHAEKVANYLGTKHTTSILTVDNKIELVHNIPYYCDEPMADTSIISTMLVSKMAKEQVSVVISGDAGDELFCGYSKYTNYNVIRKYQRAGRLLSSLDKVIPIHSLAAKCSNSNIDWLFHISTDEDLIYSAPETFWERYNGLVNGTIAFDEYKKRLDICDSRLDKYMLNDLLMYLPDDVLMKVDRASMSVSLESRAPLLDYRIIEFALSLPIDFKFKEGITKRILKDILFEYIPSDMIEKRKLGFGVPVDDLLINDYAALSRNLLSKDYIAKQGIFEYNVVDRIIKGLHSKDSRYYIRDAWTLLIFQLWYDMYMN